jgi:hypothetical protein
MKKLLLSSLLCALLSPVVVVAQQRPLCDPASCPGGTQCCSDDLMEIRFLNAAGALGGSSVTGTTGGVLNVAFTIDTKSEGIQGWSYAAKHDIALVKIDAVSEKNPVTQADAAFLANFSGGFKVLVKAFGGADRRQPDRGVGQAVVLSFVEPKVLPLADDITMAFATFTVTTAPAEGANTKIQFVDGELATAAGGPPVELNLTVAGETRRPRNVVEAQINGPVAAVCDNYAFYYGPAASNQAHAVPAGTAQFPISMRNQKAATAFELAATNRNNTLTFVSGVVGDANDNLRELIITDSDGISQTPVVPNTATIADTISSIDRGAATTASTQVEDFFFAQTNPLVGGPGFFVGFVADLTPAQSRTIPATPAADPCPVHEILLVKFGAVAVNFSRGDANGDDKVNVTDAVLIVRKVFGIGTQNFDCNELYDTDNSGVVGIEDGIFLLNWIFRRGPRPAAPFLTCGQEAAGDTTKVGCNQSNCQ